MNTIVCQDKKGSGIVFSGGEAGVICFISRDKIFHFSPAAK